MNKKTKTIGIEKFTLDLSNPPALTEEEKEQLTQLDAIKEENIDFSDIPPQMGVLWTRPGAMKSSGNERQIALPLGLEVLRYFFSDDTQNGARLINNILREYIQTHPKMA